MALHRQVRGTGPAVLLLHNGVCDSRMWDRQMWTFAEHHRVVRCDLPGFGRSPLPSAPVSYAGEVLSLLGELGIASVTIVGNSFGGRVALDVARVAPERVRALVLVAPGRREWDWSDAVRQYAEAEDAAVAAGDVERVVELNVRFWLDGPHRTPDQVEPDVRAAVATMQREGVGRLLAASGEGGGGEEPPDPAPAGPAVDVRAPTLILVGDLDVPDMLAISNRYEQELPNARRVLMRGAAHMPSLEQPAEFDRLVLDFMAEVDTD
jgi:pimeloyl-ACP methyl ester carboxylesterase